LERYPNLSEDSGSLEFLFFRILSIKMVHYISKVVACSFSGVMGHLEVQE
jgi:hypothetical protein